LGRDYLELFLLSVAISVGLTLMVYHHFKNLFELQFELTQKLIDEVKPLINPIVHQHCDGCEEVRSLEEFSSISEVCNYCDCEE